MAVLAMYLRPPHCRCLSDDGVESQSRSRRGRQRGARTRAPKAGPNAPASLLRAEGAFAGRLRASLGACARARSLSSLAIIFFLLAGAQVGWALPGGGDEDWYKVLGVPRTADEKAIRSAYRKLVLRWHPDKNPGKEDEAARVTAQLNNAYEILMNAFQRREFDERFFGVSQQPAPASTPGPASGSGSASASFSGGRAAPRPGGRAPAGPDDGEEHMSGNQDEPGVERTSTFDPRHPGRSWRSWRRSRTAAHDAAAANPGPQSFAEAAWEQALRSAQGWHTAPDPFDFKHRRSPEAAAARDERQRARDVKFQGYRNKQRKSAAKRELRRRAEARSQRERAGARQQQAHAASHAEPSSAQGVEATWPPTSGFDHSAASFDPRDPQSWPSVGKKRKRDGVRQAGVRFTQGAETSRPRGPAKQRWTGPPGHRDPAWQATPVKNGCFWC